MGGSAGRSGSAQTRVGAGGHFLPPPGKLPPGLTPASEARPVPVRRPGRWRLRATDAGTAPSPDPPGQPPDEPPKDAPGSLPGRRGQVAANEHKIGTLSRMARDRPPPPLPSRGATMFAYRGSTRSTAAEQSGSKANALPSLLCGGGWPPKGAGRGERRCGTMLSAACGSRLILTPRSPLPTPADAGATLPRRGYDIHTSAGGDALSSPVWGGTEGWGGAEGTVTRVPEPPPPMTPPHKGEGKRARFSRAWCSAEKCESVSPQRGGRRAVSALSLRRMRKQRSARRRGGPQNSNPP